MQTVIAVLVACIAAASAVCQSGDCGADGQGPADSRFNSFMDGEGFQQNSNCPASYLEPVIQEATQYGASGAQNQANYIYNKLKNTYPDRNYVIDVIQQGSEWYANTWHCNGEQCRYDTSNYVYLVYRSSGSCCSM